MGAYHQLRKVLEEIKEEVSYIQDQRGHRLRLLVLWAQVLLQRVRGQRHEEAEHELRALREQARAEEEEGE